MNERERYYFTNGLFAGRFQFAMFEDMLQDPTFIPKGLVAEIDAGAPSAWQPIATAPRDGMGMFIVCGFNVVVGDNTSCGPYTTDPVCVWRSSDGSFMRWHHLFPPTHWMPLPPSPPEGER